ncbi:DUF3426 domain-containing protein [Marinobacter bryozoorum]|uniref:DUF3426 domain-containing protein n=1 Tax=Marinobacter bryozoorum TaxID=256324 RepID=UPI0020045A40|nr:DUF3426 domain-containing protein [Marinobacter bryozoorum]MCK7545269.1 DUF3426 domain-containing protein [Marinobacter bryozoorum]
MADTSSLLTRCPHCDTRFRVTSEQLKIADGKVRCGHCMEVFDARSHADSPAQRPEANQEHFSATSPDDDLVFQDNPEADAAEGPYAGHDSHFDEDELSDSFRGVDTGHNQHGDLDDNDIDDVDESWAEAMLQEELPDSTPRPRPAAPDPAGDDGAGPRNAGNEIPAISPLEPGPRQQGHQRSGGPGAPASTDDLEIVGMVAEPEPHAGSAQTERLRDSGTGATFPPLDNITPYDRLSSEPVSVGSRPGASLRGWLWTLVVLALLAGLVSQVAWFQFDRLSAIPELRPWYEKACDYAGCELAPLVAMDRIQSRKLVVRTDPENRSALLVDAVIINQAEFEQPFPSIALTFSNLNGDVVAQSVFPPEDYLAGEGSGLDAMPPGTPVRIAISIRDPGRDAVNYNLRFVNRSGDT